ncbi:hypothetical protein KR018_006609, partial [Drosophila ironensis]
EFKKLLKETLKLNITKIHSPTGKELAFVCFRTLEDQKRALKTLNGCKWKGRVLRALAAKASAYPLRKKRAAQANQGDAGKPKKQRTSVEATCPLAAIPYEDQLKQKSEEISGLLKKYTQELKRLNPQAKPHVDSFKFQGVLPSPNVNGYRNKNEFTVGKNSVGEIVVGFRLGSYSDGSVEVAEVQDLPHLPEQVKWAARSFQTLVQQSKFLPFNPDGNVGHFRQLMVRCSSATGELMLVAGIYSSNLKENEQQELKEELKSFYENVAEDSPFKCTSLYYQDVKHGEAGQLVNPVEHILGSTHISDTIQGLQFRISPLAFFQSNTEGANVLYQKAIDLAAPTKDTTMLDICCGTGTISLAFAKHCRKVLGVEIVPDAIKDAEFNAEANGIKNCKFYTGNPDDFITSMVKDALYEQDPGKPADLIAVVNPPQTGLHSRSIAAIRSAKAINRLVYISSNPRKAKRSFLELSLPESEQDKGAPFYPKTAVAVDMSPHTTHSKLIILFEREQKAKPVPPREQ